MPDPLSQSRQQPPLLEPAKYDAVHRAVLSGLLGNVGVKGEGGDYTGARGLKFSIFPGSGLFKRNPRWVVAAELVETSRLYARTVADIKPQWLESLAAHLVKRDYREPHWQQATAHVGAYERVTLYGLPLIERRLVHYGPVDPIISREIFIRHALIMEEYRTSAGFFRHNHRLVEEIENLQAKTRRHDLLVDAEKRFEFYDQRIPPEIYNGPLFEKWLHQAEQSNPRTLFMQRDDLLLDPNQFIEGVQFPDEFILRGQGEFRLRLQYQLAPGEADDGVTAVIPLPLLTQIPAAPFEWLVPGWLEEKITELIRSLPKPLRVAFVPVPETARLAFQTMQPGDGSLLEALALFLGKRSGLPVRPSDFDAASLPAYQQMNFRLIDDCGKTVAMGRDLADIRRRLGVQARQSFAQLPPQGEYHRDNIQRWDFGDLPPHIEIRRHGLTLLAYPALVDSGKSISLRVFDTRTAAVEAMRQGLRRLFMLQTRDDIQYLQRNLPHFEQMKLHYALLGNSDELRSQLVDAAVDRTFFGETGSADEMLNPFSLRTPDAFQRQAEIGWRRLLPAAREICTLAEQILAPYYTAARLLAEDYAPALLPAVKDMRRQLAELAPKDFLTTTAAPWVRHLPRFLQAISVRLKKLTNAGLARDSQQTAILAPLQEQFAKRLKTGGGSDSQIVELEQYRWMLQELRVSLFAQELKTSMSISPKRLQAQWAKVVA